MSYFFNEEHEQFRDTLRKYFAKQVRPHINDWEKAGEIPREMFREMGKLDFLGLDVSESWGGSELDFFYSVVLFEEMSRTRCGGFAAAICAHAYLALAHLDKEGSEMQKEKYLRPGCRGEKIGCLAITEPSAGSDVANLRTTARRDGDHYVVNGAKTFITNGVLSDFLIVAVRTGGEGAAGVSLLIVDRDSDGLTASKLDKLGWHSSDTGDISFVDVRVPVENLLGKENHGFYYIMQRFELERLVMAIGAVATAQDTLEYTIDYMRERTAFKRPLSKFQVLRHRIADLAAEVEVARSFVYACCRNYSDGHAAVKECSMAKLLATELCERLINECLQCFGGYGYMEEYEIARIYRDNRIGTIGGGTSEIMREIIAKMAIDGQMYG